MHVYIHAPLYALYVSQVGCPTKETPRVDYLRISIVDSYRPRRARVTPPTVTYVISSIYLSLVRTTRCHTLSKVNIVMVSIVHS